MHIKEPLPAVKQIQRYCLRIASAGFMVYREQNRKEKIGHGHMPDVQKDVFRLFVKMHRILVGQCVVYSLFQKENA